MKKDNPGVPFPPPLILIVLGFLLYLVHLKFPFSISTSISLFIPGIIVLALGIGSMIYCVSLFRKFKTELEPWKSTSIIIQVGPYKYSRNPIYTLSCCIPIGLGLILNSYWITLSFLPGLIIIYFFAVVREEKYLEAKFGEEYLDYKNNVRRWL